MAIIKIKTNKTKYWDAEQPEVSYIAGGNTYGMEIFLFCLSKNKLILKQAVKIC